MRTIDKIITPVTTKYGAPMGRSNVGNNPILEPNMDDYKHVKCNVRYNQMYIERKFEINKLSPKVFDCIVPMSSDGAYDKGGAYWGLGSQLRVSYTKDLKYINFYRV